MADQHLFDPNTADLASSSGKLVVPASRPATLADMLRATWKKVRFGKIFLFVFSIILFVLAIMLMKEGVNDLAPLLHTIFDVANPVNSLGFGWLFAYILLSGSPVATAALTFFDAGAIDQLSALTMIIGSRLGASFIVLFIGFIYVLRGRDRTTALSMGLLSLTVTGTTYLVSLVVSIVILQTGLLERAQPQGGLLLVSVIEWFFLPIVNLLRGLLPVWTLFLIGLGIIMISFNLFDRCLPQMALKESQVGRMSRLVYRPGVMFILGGAITLISMSVSISLSILVPLSNRGFIRRENVVPYIMGANVTTFSDTLLAALFLNNPSAFTVVLAAMVGITLVSLFILSTVYRHYERLMLAIVVWVTAETHHLIIFMTTLAVVPLILMLL